MLGEGIIQGLVETARNFFGSYVEKDRLTTVQYPEERHHAAGGIAEFSVSAVRRRRSGGGAALRGVPDLREGMPAAVHSH